MTIFKNKYFFVFPIVILIFIVFFPAISGQFLNWDDTLYITMNKLMENPINFNSFLDLYDFDNNISLVLFSFLVQIKIWGFDPFSFHLFNIILHICNAILIYKITLIFLKNPHYALLSAILFSVHPMKVESVAWIIQRKDLMFTFFFLCSTLFYIKHISSNRVVSIIMVVIFGYLASLCKIQALVLPFSLLLIEYTLTKRLKIRNILFVIVLLITMLTKIRDTPALLVIIIIPILLNNYWKYMCLRYPQSISFIKTKTQHVFNLGIFKNTKIRLILNIGFVFWVVLFLLHITKLAVFAASHDIVLVNKFSNVIVWVISTTTLTFICFTIYSLLRLNNKHLNQQKVMGAKTLNKIIAINKRVKAIFAIRNITGFLIQVLFFILLIILYQILSSSQSFKFPHEYKAITLFLIITIILLITDKYNKSFSRDNFKVIAIILPIFIIIILFTYIIYNHTISTNENDFITRLFYASYSINYYLLKFIFPIDLSAMHPYPNININIATTYWFHPIISLMIISFTFLAVNKLHKSELKSHIIFGLLFFIINISIVLHIIPINGRVIVADRYTYLSYFGLVFTIIVILKHLISTKITQKKQVLVIKVIIFIIIGTLSIQSFSRSKLWNSDYFFWSDIIEKDSSNHYAYYSLGLYYYTNQQYFEAIKNYNIAINKYNGNYEYFTNRGACFVQTKNDSLALLDFGIAIQLNDKDFASYFNRGVIFFNSGEINKSKEDIQKAINIKPDYPKAITKLNQINELLNSIETHQADTTQNRNLSEYYNKIGVNFAMHNNMLKALDNFNLAIKYDTINIRAIQNRGNTYAALKDFKNAKKDFYYIIKIAPNEGGPYLNLANILHETGNVKTACEYWTKALSLGVHDAQIMLNTFCLNE